MRYPLNLSLLPLVMLFCVSFTFAAEESVNQDQPAPESEILAGHSSHGESFNEGPRQAAYLMSGTGNVHFPATCSNELVQKYIDQGVGQLHGFWYFESERSFRQAASIDPECAIAYWGMAMSNRGNEDRARGFIDEAVKRKGKVTERERMYIEAMDRFFKKAEKKEKDKGEEKKEEADSKQDSDYEKKRRQTLVKNYEEILHKFPEDIEAKAFLGLAIYENKSKGIPISSYYATDALLNDILAVNPLHPCHHFRIHLWDYERPENALNSAARCGASAPAIAHMWHMSGHIYSRLKRYHDAVWQQEASARTDHAYMMRDYVLPDQIHNFAHNNEWLIRNLIHIGRTSDAIDLAKNMIDLPRHPKYNVLSKNGSTKYGRMRLMQTLSTFQLWEQALALSDSRYLEPTDVEAEQLKRNVLLATAMYATGRATEGSDILTTLKQDLATLKAEQSAAGDAAAAKAKEEKKDDKAQKEAKERAERGFGSKVRPLESAIHELEGHLHLAHAAYADAATSFGKVSSFDKGWLAMVQCLAGDKEKAIETVNKEVSRHKNETAPLAWQVAVLWEAGEQEKAKAAFEKLRQMSSVIDLKAPLFQKLEPIALELGFEKDWRLPREIPADFGERPELAELGPFRWAPGKAAAFTLLDHQSQPHSLSDYSGRPVVVIFYLGFGCLHCAEQLQAFAPMAEKFNAAGIDLIAVSTDNMTDLKLSQENYGTEKFPFPLVSNSDLDIFKKYRCYDDFEQKTLHGTFLIDAEGLIRWQDISYEPFMDAKFLLGESQRLLSQPAKRPETNPADVTAVD